MEKRENIQSNLFELESQRADIIIKTLNSYSVYKKLNLYQDYFEKVLRYNNPSIEEAFLKEFVEDFLYLIKRFEVYGVEPLETEKLLDTIKKVVLIKVASEINSELNSEIIRIEVLYKKLKTTLEGEINDNGTAAKAQFLVVDKEAPEGFYGILEAVTVRIAKGIENNSFIIVPSEKEIEKKINKQIQISWELAISLSKKYIKKSYKYHEVIVSFNNRDGTYEGNSLGIALTLTMLEELLKHYNPTYTVSLKNSIALTGGIDRNGEVFEVGNEIAKQKTAIVFFSSINVFVISKADYASVKESYNELKRIYPNRHLKIVPVEEIDDVLNRRDLVEIKKQKLLIRTGKFVKKNWLSAAATVLLAIFFGFIFVMDFDDNPYSITTDGSLINIKNKRGRILWSKELMYNFTPNSISVDHFCQIIDINDDGRNEVIISDEDFSNIGKEELGRISCYDQESNLIWKYQFQDSIETKNEKHNNIYTVKIISVGKEDREGIIYCYADNTPLFPSAIFKLSAKTGKRLTGTLWNAGHIVEALYGDFNEDEKMEIVALGLHNGFNSTVFFSIDIENLNGQTPTVPDYLFENIHDAIINKFILIPPSDLTKYYNIRLNVPDGSTLRFENGSKEFRFLTREGSHQNFRSLHYRFEKGLRLINIYAGNSFEEERNLLVKEGKLKTSLPDIEDYIKEYENSFLYWKNGKFVKREELK